MRDLCPPPLRRLKEEMVLTRPLELLPLLTLAALSLPPLSPPVHTGAEYSPDTAALRAHLVHTLPQHTVCQMALPRLHVLHLANEAEGWIPAAANDDGGAAVAPGTTGGSAAAGGSDAAAPTEEQASERASPPSPSSRVAREISMPRGMDISPAGVYLLDGGFELIVWVGSHAAPVFKAAIFGTETPQDGAALAPASSSPEARRLHQMIATARLGRAPSTEPLRVLVQGSVDSARFFGRLIADGYEPFVLGLHSSRVQPKL